MTLRQIKIEQWFKIPNKSRSRFRSCFGMVLNWFGSTVRVVIVTKDGKLRDEYLSESMKVESCMWTQVKVEGRLW